MIIVQSIFLIKKGKTILNDISCTLNAGEVLCIAGPNGAGKSSFLKAITGVDSDVQGVSSFDGLDLLSKERIEAIEKIGFMLSPDSFYDYLSVSQNLTICRNYYKDSAQTVQEIIDIFNLSAIAKQKVSTLSMGQKQRVAIAMAFVNKPELLLLDEPFNSIDNENTKEIIKTIIRLNQEFNTTFIVTSHGLSELEKIYTRFMVIKSGEVVFDNYKKEIEPALTIHSIYNELTQ